MKIERLSSEHFREVGALHCAGLSGLLAELGPAAARAYYRVCVEEPLATTVVAIEGGRVCGFVSGSSAPEELRRVIRRKGALKLAASIAWGALRRPVALRWLVREFFGAGGTPFDRSVPELTYLLVTEKKRGLGRTLVDAFSAELAARGERRYELSVDEDNSAAIAFYERIGFTRIGKYEEFGRRHFRYSTALTPKQGREKS